MAESNIHILLAAKNVSGEWYEVKFKEAVDIAKKETKCKGKTIKRASTVVIKYRRTIQTIIDEKLFDTLFVEVNDAAKYTGLSPETIIDHLKRLEQADDRKYIFNDNGLIKVPNIVLTEAFWGSR